MPDTDEQPRTEPLHLPHPASREESAVAAPVFVDASGRRRRVAHRLAVALFLAAGGYALMVIWSLLGGPVSPDTLMPFSAPRPTSSPSSGLHPAAVHAQANTAPTTPHATHTTSSGASTHRATPTTSAPAVASPSPTSGATSPGRRPTAPPGKGGSSTAPGHGR